jgi:hypothetical protein
MSVPTVTSASIATNGLTLTINFSEAVYGVFADLPEFGFFIVGSVDKPAIVLTYVSGDTTATAIFTSSRIITNSESVYLGYTGSSAASVSTDDYLDTFTDFEVTNNSEQEDEVSEDSIEGDVTYTLDLLTYTVTGSLSILGVTDFTLSSLTNIVTGSLSIEGITNNTLDELTYIVTGISYSEQVEAVVSYTLDELTYDSAGVLTNHFGIVYYTLDALTYESTGVLAYEGQVDYVLSDIISDVSSNLPSYSETDYTLDPLETDIYGLVGDVNAGSIIYSLDSLTYLVTGWLVDSASNYGGSDYILDDLEYSVTIALKNKEKRKLFLASGSLFSKDGLFLCSN